MPKKQLFLFSLAFILIMGSGNGMANMLPMYLRNSMGVDSGYIGGLFSLLYAALSVGAILAGWLSDRFQRRKLMCVLSAAGEIAAGLLLISARSLAMLSAALILSWFLAGMHMALVNVLVGLQAEEKKRGQVFGTLGFVMGLGPILSGFLFGPIMDAYGMQALLVISLVTSILWTVISLFYKDVPRPVAAASKPERSRAPLGWTFALLFGASMLGWFTINGGKLGISILMNDLGYSAGSISTTAGVASLAALAMPLLMGWLSDRTGRKRLILGLNLLGMAGLVILSQVYSLAGFWAASALLSLYSCFSGLTNALVTDLVPRQALGLGLSLITNASNIAGIISSVGLGLAFSSLGPGTTFLAALTLPVVAALLVALVKEPRRPAAERPVLLEAGG